MTKKVREQFGTWRAVALTSEAVDLWQVELQQAGYRDATVKSFLPGLPIASFRKAWAKACERAEVPGRLFHDLRRCAAKNLVEAGVPIPVAMKITGHKTISMFQRYAIIEPKLQREALRQAEVCRAEQLAQQITKLQGQEAHA